jgi:AhpD family alkylhydroperoxidase
MEVDMSIPLAFPPLGPDSAPEAIRPVLAGSMRTFGFLPSPVARVAHSPVALKHLLAGFAAFDHTSLAPVEREVIAMSVAWENACRYCMSMHSAMLAGAPEHAETVAALRSGEPIPDARLEALRRYVQAIVRGRGRAPDDVQSALVEAGFTAAQALEIVLGIGVYLTSTLLNIVTRAELDAPFAAFSWEPPVEVHSG